MPLKSHFLSSDTLNARPQLGIRRSAEQHNLAEIRLDPLFADTKRAQILVIGLAAVIQCIGNTLTGPKIVKNI